MMKFLMALCLSLLLSSVSVAEEDSGDSVLILDSYGNSLKSTNNALNVSASAASDLFASGSITAQDTASSTSTNFNGQTWYSGTPTASSYVSSSLVGIETAVIEVSGTWTGTIQVEVSTDGGTNWIAHPIHQIGSSAFITNFTANISGSLNLAGKTNLRCRATAAFTGTASVRFNLSQNPSSVYVANSIKLVDGSSSTSGTTMNIAPASTAVASTNTAVAVGLSPNSPLPAGTNALGTVAVTKQVAPINANGALSATQSVGTTESSLAAPSNAVGVIVESDSTNLGNVRWGFSNSTSPILSSTLGMLMEPGRSTDQLSFGTGSYLHLISLSGTNSVNVQWILSQ